MKISSLSPSPLWGEGWGEGWLLIQPQNSNVLESDTCRESPIDTKNRLAAEV